jgi:hypothetical protein
LKKEFHSKATGGSSDSKEDSQKDELTIHHFTMIPSKFFIQLIFENFRLYIFGGKDISVG